MNEELIDHLKSLHTAAIDARNGYTEALEDAKGQGMTPLFAEMIALHTGNAEELAGELLKLDERPDDSGSFMTTLHRTIMSVRAMFHGLGSSVLPGLIDGETRNVKHYDGVLKESGMPAAVTQLLLSERARLLSAIAKMRAAELHPAEN